MSSKEVIKMQKKFGYIGAAALLCQALYANEQLNLSDAYALALKNESKTKSAEYRAESSEEMVAQVRSRLLPQVQYSYSTGNSDYEVNYYPKPTKEKYTYNQFSLIQPLYHPEYWSAASQAYKKRDGAKLDYQRQTQILGLDLAKAYFTYLKTKKEESLAKTQMEQYESKYKQLDKMLSMGLTNKIDMLESKIAFDKAKAEWLTKQKQLFVTKFALEKFIGVSLEDKTLFEPEKINTKALGANKEEWLAKLSSNMDVRLAEISKEVAQKEVRVRFYDHFPKVDIRLSDTRTDSKDPSARKYDRSAFLDVKIPIFQGGYTTARVSEAKLLLNAASEDLDNATKEAKLKFEDLWSRRQLAIEYVELYKESEKASELHLQAVEKAHTAGLKSIVDLLEARAKLYQTRKELLDATYELINNQMELLAVVGELNMAKIIELEDLVYGQKG